MPRFCDSGLVHTLLRIGEHESLLGHHIAGMSWAGFVLADIISVLPEGCQNGFYRTGDSAEIDLILCFARGDVWAIEIKRSTTPKARKGFYIACDDIQPDRRMLIYAGEDAFPQSSGIEVLGLSRFLDGVKAC